GADRARGGPGEARPEPTAAPGRLRLVRPLAARPQGGRSRRGGRRHPAAGEGTARECRGAGQRVTQVAPAAAVGSGGVPETEEGAARPAEGVAPPRPRPGRLPADGSGRGGSG